MTEAIIKELELQKGYLQGEVLQTIYFGGGTPSLLKSEELQAIIKAVEALYTVSNTAEITLEGNPDDLDRAKLDTLRELGVNRLSIGIQSFDDDVLTYFNRAHSSREAFTCIEDARAAGFTNISIDLIYGTPGLDDAGWLRNIGSAIAMSPEHISAYALTIEDKTVFGRRASRGELKALPEELVAVQFETMMSEMTAAGYEHYEISNFAKPGLYSKHNTSYWEQKPYLGVGPSAHSYNGLTRQFNISNNSLYIKALQEGRVPFELEKLSRANMINEFIMTRLRTSDGLDLDYLARTFGYDLRGLHRGYLDELCRMEKITYHGSFLLLTNNGKLLADKISADLFVSAE